MKNIIIASLLFCMSCSSSKKNKVEDLPVPPCINSLIDGFKREEVKNPPRSVYQYKYKDQIVYYVPAICCDFFSDLYDDQCKLLGHPDGGYTGRGDGTYTDFIDLRTDEKLIWKDDRK